MRRLFAPVLGIAVLLLSGCFDFTEEVWVNKDKSARVAWTYGFDERDLPPDQVEGFKAEFQKMAEDFRGREGVTKSESRYELSDGLHKFTVDTSVANFRTLESLGSTARARAGSRGLSSPQGSKTDFRFEELEGGRMRWTRSLATEQGSAKQFQAAALELAKKGNHEPRQHRMTYIFHAPRIDAAEAASFGSKSAEWSFGMDEEIPASITADFRFAGMFPWGLALGGAAMLGGFVWLRKKWQQRWM